jgi:hypothetical protein
MKLVFDDRALADLEEQVIAIAVFHGAQDRDDNA